VIVRCCNYFGSPVAVVCDGNCAKAWGLNSRPRRQLSENEDDYMFLPDEELGEAPADPGTYEGNDGKPTSPEDQMNRWCVRECERSTMVDFGQRATVGPYVPRPNIPRSEP
jgi:hypothetical protein